MLKPELTECQITFMNYYLVLFGNKIFSSLNLTFTSTSSALATSRREACTIIRVFLGYF
jgi:hypothetical protein